MALQTLLSNPLVRDSVFTRGAGFAPTSHFDASLDPRLGAKVTLPSHDLFGVTIKSTPAKSAILVVCCGQCSECSIAGLKTMKVDTAAYGSVVLIYTGDERQLRLSTKKIPKEFRIVHDPGSTYHKSLNAAFIPRFALLDSERKLLALQTEPDHYPTFVRFNP